MSHFARRCSNSARINSFSSGVRVSSLEPSESSTSTLVSPSTGSMKRILHTRGCVVAATRVSRRSIRRDSVRSRWQAGLTRNQGTTRFRNRDELRGGAIFLSPTGFCFQADRRQQIQRLVYGVFRAGTRRKTSQGSLPPATTWSMGWGLNRAALNIRNLDRLRDHNLFFKCLPSNSSWPIVTVIETACLRAAILEASKLYPLAFASSTTLHRYVLIAATGFLVARNRSSCG